jgi:hypothetical protein
MSKDNDKTILRGRRRSAYTVISNSALQDTCLSLESIGLLACILSFPEHWAFNRAHARHRFGIGREKLDRILKELKDAGYVRHTQERDEHGRMSRSVYIFTEDAGQFDEDEPLPEKPYHGGSPLPGKPSHGQPSSGKSAPIKRKQTQKEHIKKGARAPISNFSRKKAEPVAIAEPPPEVRKEVATLMDDFAKSMRMRNPKELKRA